MVLAVLVVETGGKLGFTGLCNQQVKCQHGSTVQGQTSLIASCFALCTLKVTVIVYAMTKLVFRTLTLTAYRIAYMMWLECGAAVS